jgi:hypothetical protein
MTLPLNHGRERARLAAEQLAAEYPHASPALIRMTAEARMAERKPPAPSARARLSRVAELESFRSVVANCEPCYHE